MNVVNRYSCSVGACGSLRTDIAWSGNDDIVVFSVCWIHVIVGSRFYKGDKAVVEKANTLGNMKANRIVECDQVYCCRVGAPQIDVIR